MLCFLSSQAKRFWPGWGGSGKLLAFAAPFGARESHPVRYAFQMVSAALLLSATGCILGNRPQFIRGGSDHADTTYFLDGAGNLGFGKETVPLGLEDGGYHGQIEHFIWTTYLGPVLDQMYYSHNRRQGRRLADKIASYLDKHPGGRVNIIGLSAGTGVAVFALESLPAKYQVENAIMLSSSLSADYDLSRALRRVRGGMYFFWSPNDPILRGLVPVVGTVDRENTYQVAGAVGAKLPPGAGGESRQLYVSRVRNIRWYNKELGSALTLQHAGTTDRRFICEMVAPILARSEMARAVVASPAPSTAPAIVLAPSSRPARAMP